MSRRTHKHGKRSKRHTRRNKRSTRSKRSKGGAPCDHDWKLLKSSIATWYKCSKCHAVKTAH